MNKLIKWISSKKWGYKLATRILANRIVFSKKLLTRDYLHSKGWEAEGKYWTQKDVKDRYKIWIEFENGNYRVWHGKEKTFIALESRLEWFEIYYLMLHGDNGRFELAGI